MAITNLGWGIQRESNIRLVVELPKVNGCPACEVKVWSRHGFMTIVCETEDLQIMNTEGKMIVDRFLQAIDQCISESASGEQRSLKQSLGLSFK